MTDEQFNILKTKIDASFYIITTLNGLFTLIIIAALGKF